MNVLGVASDNPHRLTDFLKVTGSSSRFVALTGREAAEHEHQEIQITIPFFNDVFTAKWHTAAGESCHRIVRAGECCVIPSGQSHRFNWQGPAEIVNLYLEPSWLEQISDEANGRGGLYVPEDYRCQNPVLLQLGAALREAYGRPPGPVRLLIEGMVAVVAVRLMRRRTTGRAVPARTDKLSPRSLRRALDYTFRVDADKTRLLNFYLPGGFEEVTTEFGVPATSRRLPPAGLKGAAIPEKMKALFQKLGMSPVALPDVLRKAQ